MVDQVIARGQVPVMFLMNRATSQALAETLAAAYRERLSTFRRLWLRIRHGHAAPRLEALYGVPVIQADYLPDGGIVLQVGDRAGMGQNSSCAPPAAAGQANTSPQVNAERLKAAEADPEFWKKERVQGMNDAMDGVAAGEIRPTLNDLSSGNGERPSASDVLMKAMDDVDDLNGVVVVRVHRNGSVDLCLNVDQFAAQGVLQRAQMFLAQRGY
jgi:hypothetical protein